ncbi:uracil-DNA glycosylase [Candidatus Woesearchaeota archaeon]|nr:uracil-DNA glycosylase [Candidatus Woesearchaeota archaeon]
MNKQQQLEEVKQSILNANLPLKETATSLVFGKGNPDAQILFIGEAPGKWEDQQGIPFVGKAGKLLDEFLNTISLALNDVYIANILKYRPPNNRDPNHEEIKAHTPYLVRQIEIIRPPIIITLGNYATRFILADCNPEKMDSIPGITALHGKEKEATINNRTYKVIPMYHPAALIYNQKLKPEAVEDFKRLRDVINQKSLSSFS